VAALDYMHRKGIVHRDVNLSNCVLYASHTHLKLTNFARSAVVSCFTPAEASAGDVWDSGAVLYAMVTGLALPGSGAPSEQSLAKLSPALAEMLRCIFQPNVDLRITMAELWCHEWVNVGYARPVPRIAIDSQRTQLLPEEAVKRDLGVFLRPDLLVLMETAFGFPVEVVIESQLAEQINHCSAIYRMLEVRCPGCDVCV
jgi:serine/threonine protein kinase